MRKGEIKRKDGTAYQSTADFVKIFKAFWHWYMKSSKKKGKEIKDITEELDTSREKPNWVYLTEDQIKKLCDNAKYDYRILIMFLYDTGIRAPTELMNVKVSDFFNDFKELNIREEISKTFGRRIKLLLSSKLIKEYIQNKGLGKEDFVFPISPPITNKYLQRLAKKLFGDAVSEAGQKYSQLTMYDFRHNACCYWLPRYKSESAIKYRFGWKKFDKIHYYSELLGMKDTITEEDLFLDLTKTEMEKRLLESEKQNQILMEKFDTIQQQSNEGALLIADLQRKMKELQEARQN
jgi:integrase